jgi:hypothetical protein
MRTHALLSTAFLVRGAAAFYTDRVPSFKMVRRVMRRWYTWLNYVKLSM